jgi:hypothetical protein
LEAALLGAETCCINETLATVWLELCFSEVHGVAARPCIQAVIQRAVPDLVLPGFEHVGVPIALGIGQAKVPTR